MKYLIAIAALMLVAAPAMAKQEPGQGGVGAPTDGQAGPGAPSDRWHVYVPSDEDRWHVYVPADDVPHGVTVYAPKWN